MYSLCKQRFCHFCLLTYTPAPKTTVWHIKFSLCTKKEKNKDRKKREIKRTGKKNRKETKKKEKEKVSDNSGLFSWSTLFLKLLTFLKSVNYFLSLII